MANKIYCGYPKDGTGNEPLVIFHSAIIPTHESHGELYAAVIGPFRTKRAAKWMSDPTTGRMNPHCQYVADAERLAKKYAGAAH